MSYFATAQFLNQATTENSYFSEDKTTYSDESSILSNSTLKDELDHVDNKFSDNKNFYFSDDDNYTPLTEQNNLLPIF